MASSSSSSSSSLWKFTVFLSFRGSDTRKTFVSFLYKELVRMGIETFKDDKELESGSSISPELLQAIEESKFAIVVVSENYASSGWCLEELTKILECHEKGTLTAIPVFYEVEPSDVRRQSGKFGQHMKKHEGRENPEKVQSWKDALTKLANLSGECSNEDDSELVDKIVSDILNRFISATPSDFGGLVGMDVRMKAMHRLLALESKNEVRVIGIWGMGGIGKTTLARYVYEEISRHFQTHCFLENVKKIYQDGGPSRLQEELLSKTQGRALTVRSSYLGFNVIKSMLGHQRFLLVVDDVDKIEQLDALAKERSWFGPGSRVIVTARDKHLLNAGGVKHVYEVKRLEYSEALQLFHQSAFRDRHSLTGFGHLSNRAVKLAGGLPLAISLFGSFLSHRAKEDWKVALDRLERSPHKDIMEILKISYEGLDERDKHIFLRIACFFNYEHVDRVTSLVDDNVEHAKFGIRVLVDRSLIVISSNGGLITMHDLVQKMGKKLAAQQSPDEPRKRLILSEPDEICDALTDELGNKAIEGISFDTAEVDELAINPKALEKMSNLKFFQIYTSSYHRETNISLTSDLNFFVAKLRYLRWDRCPSKTIQFRPKWLVELDLRYSKLEKFWEGTPCLPNLKKIDLSWSTNLKEFPNLSNAPNLECINTSNCKSLVEIPSSVFGLSKLTAFNLSECDNLVRVPNNWTDMKSLESLVLHGCSNLKVIPRFSGCIKLVTISGRRQRELSESIGYLSHLERLWLTDFELLENLPDTIGNLTALQGLGLIRCHVLQRIPETVGDLTSLKELNLRHCPKLERIPETIRKLKSLENFQVSECWNITEFPHLPENVKNVTIIDIAVEEIPSWIGDIYCLEALSIVGNERLKCFPTSIYNLKALKRLHLSCGSNMESFSTRVFRTMNCSGELDSEEISVRMRPLSIFANLTSLEILRDEKSNGVPFRCPHLASFPSLRELRLEYLNMLEIPDDLGQLILLQLLDLRGNDFEKIPASIRQLTKLERLNVSSCENLCSLPELPSSAITLLAQGCVALETTKNMLSLQFILLNNCFNLKGDQHVTSRHWHGEFACLPGGKVPSSFNYRNTGHSLKVSLFGEQHSGMYLGFAACIVVVFEDSSCFEAFRIGWTCKYLRGGSGQIVLNHDFDSWTMLGGPLKDVACQSDHLCLFKEVTDKENGIGAVFDEVEFEFKFEICEDYRKGLLCNEMLSQLEVKECGVNLYFRDDLKVGTQRSSPYSGYSSNPEDKKLEIKLNAHEPASRITRELNDAISSSLPLTCGDSNRYPDEPLHEENDANRKRSRGSIDNKSITDSQEEEEESSFRKSKYIRSFI